MRFYVGQGVRVRTHTGWERGRVTDSETDGSCRARLDCDGEYVTTWPKHRGDMLALVWDADGEEIAPSPE